MYIRAMCLEMLSNASRDLTSLDNYINDELIRRLDVVNANYIKLFKQMINIVKKIYKNDHKLICKTFKTKKKKLKNKNSFSNFENLSESESEVEAKINVNISQIKKK